MAGSGERVGLLLVNLGTPDSPGVADVRRYLREFLSDPRVIDLPAAARWLLLHAVILPFRPRRSAAAYASIWSEEGSPLFANSLAFTGAVAESLGERYAVELGMRYGSPSIGDALHRLERQGVDRILALPLFPQYASSSSGSALQRIHESIAARGNVPPIQTLGPFYDDPGFVKALAAVTGPPLDAFEPDHLVMSFHGLPERQVRKSDPSGSHCLEREDCCQGIGAANRFCYRAHCFATARGLAAALGLADETYTVAFQSRLGWTPWIRPFTDQLLPDLAQRGVRRLAVVCPSFVADCLETLEEIGIRARAQWQTLCDGELLLVPCLNAQPEWVGTVVGWVRGAARETESARRF